MLKKDLIELCLLHLLSTGDRYGYEVLSLLHAAFPDTQESAVYAILRALGKGGYTRQYQGEVSGGPARKYYRLTDAGRERYAALLRQWRAMCAALRRLGIDSEEMQGG